MNEAGHGQVQDGMAAIGQHAAGPTMLNLGCGERTHPDWINIDHSLRSRLRGSWILRTLVGTRNPPGYLHHDLRRGIPFASGSVDMVYSSHVLEHLEKQAAPAFLREMHRVLRPGGVVRVVVPDLERAAVDYLAALRELRRSGPGDGERVERHEWATILLLDQMVRSRPGGEMTAWLRGHRNSAVVREMGGVLGDLAAGEECRLRPRLLCRLVDALGLRDPARTGELHRWMYDDASLGRLLEETGFRDVRSVSHLESRLPGWEGYCLDNNPDGSAYMPASIWLEGSR